MPITDITIKDPDTGDNTADFLAGGRKFTLGMYLISCLLAVMIPACAVSRDYSKPQTVVPDGWRVEYKTAADLANTAWWEQFQDPVLSEMIKTALNENKDLRIAAARVEEFAGRLQTAQSGFYPQVNYGGSLNRDYQSQERPVPQLVRGAERGNSIYQTTLNVNWEIDVWGRLKKTTEAARADLLSSEEVRRAVILTLVSDVASAYIELLALDKLLLTAWRTHDSHEELLRLFERKYEGGQVSGLELSQVRAVYEDVSEFIPDVERKIAQKENALSVLLGRNPGPVSRGKTLDTLVMPEVPKGIPSDLLARRPDIRQSEQDLIAANARIEVARTQYFPSISLTGLFGFASSSLTNLFQGSANLWQAGAGTVGHIFSGGRIEGEVRQAEAKEQQLLNSYLGTIQTAFREVNDSLVAIEKQRELVKIQERHISALKDNVSFAWARYDAKYISYLEVVDAERNLFNSEIKHVQTQNDIFAALVSNYKAMGGGWVNEAEKLIVLPKQKTEAAVLQSDVKDNKGGVRQ